MKWSQIWQMRRPAFYAPTAGIVCPFNLNIALAENAYTNGVDFKFNTEVTDIRRIEADGL